MSRKADVLLMILPVAGVVGVVVVAGMVFLQGRRLDAELKRIRDRGEPVSAAELAGPAIPDTENAAVVYAAAFKVITTSTARKDLSAVSDFADPRKRAKKPELWDTMTQITRKYARVRPLVQQAAARPKCRFPVRWQDGQDAQLTHYSKLRDLSRVLGAMALVDARAGRMAEAAQAIRLQLATAESFRDEPTLIGQFSRYSVVTVATRCLRDSLAFGRFTELQAKDLYDSLGRIDLYPELVRAMQGERAVGLSAFEEWGTKSPWGRADELYYLKTMGQAIEASKIPYREATLRKKAGDSYTDPPRYAMLSDLLLPVFARCTAAREDAIARLRMAQAALALSVYRSRTGSYPASLAELKSLSGWKTAPDPYSGKDLVYRRNGSSFLLYSVRDDLKDNGGRLDDRSGAPSDLVWNVDPPMSSSSGSHPEPPPYPRK